MMLPYLTVLVAATATTAAAAAIARPTTLYATHYNGNIYTLHLHPNGSLTTDSAQKACGDMPSWLTLDSSTRTLYCSDESGSPSKNGSLTSLAVQDGGYLSERAKTVTPGGGVNSVIYTSSGGGKHLAIAH